MTSTCPSCKGPRSSHQYLCRGCWFQVPKGGRAALTRRDDKALTRLRELLAQLDNGVPLGEIAITP